VLLLVLERMVVMSRVMVAMVMVMIEDLLQAMEEGSRRKAAASAGSTHP